MGGQLRVVVSAYNGRIIHAAPAHDPRFAYHPVRPRGRFRVPPQQRGNAAAARAAPELREPTPPLPRTARTHCGAAAAGARAAEPPAGERPGYDRIGAGASGAHAAAAAAARDRRERDRGAAAAPAPAPKQRRAETSPEAETSPQRRPSAGSRGTERGAGNASRRRKRRWSRSRRSISFRTAARQLSKHNESAPARPGRSRLMQSSRSAAYAAFCSTTFGWPLRRS